MRNIMASPELIDEAVAHPFYSSDEKAIFEQQESKREAPSIPHQSTRREHVPANIMDRKACRASPIKEAGSKNRNAKRRSSIALLTVLYKCNRCRKRKIKCSGENDEGLACTNCRSAGTTNCHFVRVNSKVLQTKFPEWPYSAMGAAVLPTSRLDMYTQHMDSKSAALSNARLVPHSGFPSYDLGPMDSNPAFSRQVYGMDYSISNEDEAYNGHPMLPSNNAPQGVPDYYGPWNAKGWEASFNFSKSPSETIFPEQVASNSLAQAYPYMLPGQGATQSDIPSLVTGSLLDSQGIDRTLPNPAARAQLQSSFTSSPEDISNLSFSPEYRPDNNNPWGTKYAPSATTHRGSINSLTSEPFSTSPPEQQKPDKPDPDMVLGFMPLTPPTPTNTNTNTTTTTTPFTGLDAVDSTTAVDFRILSDARLDRPFSRDSNNNGNANGRLLSVSTASATSSDCSHPESSYNYSSSSGGGSSENGQTQTCNASSTLATVAELQSHSHLLPAAEMQRTLRGY